MINTFKQLLVNQYDAVFCTLHRCITKCPNRLWDQPVATHPFCRVAFHTLFYADFYLGLDEPSFYQQSFHKEHAEFFRDYEELEYREPVHLYDRAGVERYLNFCVEKARQVIPRETEATLSGPSGFERRDITRAELYVYNIRHIHHHTAQLSLRLRLDEGIEIPWMGTGWQDD